MLRQENGANRPFWLHQLVDYLIGAVFVSTAFGSATPIVPSAIGGLVILNAAMTDGGAGAFRLMSRKVHKYIDLVLLALTVVAAVQPMISIDGNARLTMGLLAVVLAFVWYNSDFALKGERKQRRANTARPDAEVVGRSAGRAAADTVNAARRLKKAVDDRNKNAAD